MKRTITLPITIKCWSDLRFQVRTDEPRSGEICIVELTHPGVNQFGATIIASCREVAEFAPEEFNDVEDAVHYFASKYYASLMFGLQD